MLGRRREEQLFERLEELADAITAATLPQTSQIRKVVSQRVVVHLAAPDSRSIAGVLTGHYADCITIGAARLLVEGAGPVSIDGETIIPLQRVAFIQAGVEVTDADLR